MENAYHTPLTNHIYKHQLDIPCTCKERTTKVDISHLHPNEPHPTSLKQLQRNKVAKLDHKNEKVRDLAIMANPTIINKYDKSNLIKSQCVLNQEALHLFTISDDNLTSDLVQ